MRRSPLKRASARKRRQRRAAQPVVDAVMERDGGCVLRVFVENEFTDRCFGALSPHHLRKQSQGGEWTAENLVTLCHFHNGFVEDWPSTAHRLGLVVRNGETSADAWARMRRAGLAVGGSA